MGSQKQADTIVTLVAKRRASTGQPPLTLHERERVRGHVIESTPAQVRAMFDKLNAELGFEPNSSPATDRQLAVIRRLEAQASGRSTTTFRSGLTYAEASSRIKLLLSEKADRSSKPAVAS